MATISMSGHGDFGREQLIHGHCCYSGGRNSNYDGYGDEYDASDYDSGWDCSCGCGDGVRFAAHSGCVYAGHDHNADDVNSDYWLMLVPQLCCAPLES